jgi:cell wall-associated NlpC family hydrolase
VPLGDSLRDSLGDFRKAFRDEYASLRQGVGGDSGTLDSYAAWRSGSNGIAGDDSLAAYGRWRAGAASGDLGGAASFGGFGGYQMQGTDPFSLHTSAHAHAQYDAQLRAQDEAAARAQRGTPGARGVSGQDVPSGRDNQTLTGEQIDNWIRQTRPNSPLIGMGDYILYQANAKDVSVPELMGILLKESELGTTAGPGFNVAGVGGAGNFTQYGGWQQSVDGAINNLASDLYRGRTLEEHIGYWYAGPERYKKWGSRATDAGDGSAPSPNGSVADYINGPVATAYAGLGVRRGGAGTVPPSDILGKAQPLIGKVGYTSGGVRNTGNIADGADCSSFAGWLIGADPNDWNAQRLYDVSTRVDPTQLQPGDLVFFNIANPGDATARPVGHVAVWLGDGKIVQSTTLNGTNGAQIVDLNQDDYLRAHIYGYGRYGSGGQAAATPPRRPMVRGPVRY